MDAKKINELLGMPTNSKHYGSLLDTSSTLANDILECDQHRYNICGIQITTLQLSILISIIAVITQVSILILWPIYLADLVQVDGDPYVATVIFNISNLFVVCVLIVIRLCCTGELPLLRPNIRYVKAALYGFFAAMHDILLTFSSLPTRTGSQLLGILSAAILPNTIICRYIILRKGVSIKQLLCAACVFFGLFASLIPEIFSLSPQDGSAYHSPNTSHPVLHPQNNSGPDNTSIRIDGEVVYSWVWPLILVGSTAPIAISFVILEEEIKSLEVSFLSFVLWAEVFRCLALVALFWTSLIPNFGIADDIDKFLTDVGRGLFCSFSGNESCRGILASGITFMCLSPAGTMTVILLTKYSEGAIYTMIIKTSAKPTSTLFWTLFIDAGSCGLLWRPQFNINTIMAFVGLLFIVPATCLYAYLSNRQQTSNMSNDIELKEIK